MKTIIRSIFYKIPVPLRYLVRRIVFLPQDLFKKRHELVPPKGLIYTGGGDYLKAGVQFFDYFIKYCHVKPNHKVLDIGCGMGRMAIPFTTYLSKEGSYDGFDIVKLGIDWCTKKITSKYHNFNFKLIPLRNDLYRLDTENKASKLKFPYHDSCFDFVFLTSVFTHMMPEDLIQYINEISRVLKKDQQCFATFFIIDKESETSMKIKGSKVFPYDYDNYFLMDKAVKEANVAYTKSFILETLKNYNFEVSHYFRGNWSGIQDSDLKEHQDIFIFKKQ
jgi:ubiquinone/menaquinone biosynthesis C-methylase UbiE